MFFGVFMAKDGTSGNSSSVSSLFQKLSTVERKLSSTAKPQDVHHLRTTCRRIETLISVHEEKLGGAKALVKRLARIRRRAGKVRDYDVQMDALRGIAIESITREKARLMAELERGREKQERKLVARVAEEFDSSFRKRAKKIEGELVELNGSGTPPYGMLALDKFAVVANDYATINEDNLHDFRIACKHVRYVAELGQTPEAVTVTSECKRVQDAIGEWHDFMVLTKRASRLFAGRSALVAALRTIESAKLAEALRVTAEVKRKLEQLRSEMRPGPARADAPQLIVAAG